MGEEKGERREEAGVGFQKVPSLWQAAPSFTKEHIKQWIKAVLRDSWQLQGGGVRTAKTLFRQIFAQACFERGTEPGSQRIFQFATGSIPQQGMGPPAQASAM